jgi:hypothetical protein
LVFDSNPCAVQLTSPSRAAHDNGAMGTQFGVCSTDVQPRESLTNDVLRFPFAPTDGQCARSTKSLPVACARGARGAIANAGGDLAGARISPFAPHEAEPIRAKVVHEPVPLFEPWDKTADGLPSGPTTAGLSSVAKSRLDGTRPLCAAEIPSCI